MPTPLHLYVKKLISDNPTQYRYITLKEAMEQYDEYITYCTKYIVASVLNKKYDPDIDKPKTFKQWLKTEI